MLFDMISQNQIIFLISQPRAGSTLLQALLSNNSYVDTRSEPWVMFNHFLQLKPGLLRGGFHPGLAADALRNALGDENDAFMELTKKHILDTYDLMSRPGYRYFLDKTPRYYELIDELYDLLPHAKFIVLVRDPLDVLKSIMTTWNRRSFYELSRYHGRDIFEGPIKIAAANEKYFENPQFSFVHFQELVDSPEKVVAGLCSWLSIPFDESMLNYSENTSFHGKYGDDKSVRVNQSVNTGIETGKVTRKDQKLLDGYSNWLNSHFYPWFENYNSGKGKGTLRFSLFSQYYTNQHHFRERSLSIGSRIKNFMINSGIWK